MKVRQSGAIKAHELSEGSDVHDPAEAKSIHLQARTLSSKLRLIVGCVLRCDQLWRSHKAGHFGIDSELTSCFTQIPMLQIVCTELLGNGGMS